MILKKNLIAISTVLYVISSANAGVNTWVVILYMYERYNKLCMFYKDKNKNSKNVFVVCQPERKFILYLR